MRRLLVSSSRLRGATAALACGAAAALGGACQAQSLSNNGASFNAGYGSNGAGLNSPINVSTRDANQNSIFVNGVMQTPEGSVFSRTNGFSQTGSSGVGGGRATAIGNNLSVVVQGSYNRVTVDSTQINNGDISANASLNGQLDLDGP